jgi:hypothetical protein
MKFKFGFTVMNYLQTNSPDAFELCLSLDAPDTYFNLKTLFDLKMEEFEFFFELETPAFCLPSVFLLSSFCLPYGFRGEILCDFVYKTSADSSEETSLAAIWLNKEYVDSPAGPWMTLHPTL